jgi:hypothetical protein
MRIIAEHDDADLLFINVECDAIEIAGESD